MESLIKDPFQGLSQAPLQELFQAIAQAQDEAELKHPIMERVGTYFMANRWGLHFLEQIPAINDNIPAMLKLALSLGYNPVLRYVVQRHTAVHEEVILPPGIWQKICPRADHGHVMLGPIVMHSQLIGGIAFTRHRDDLAFNADNLADLSALCLHFSTRLATLRSRLVPFDVECDRLTPRETQISTLVAQGLTNREIGAALYITENSVKQALKRMFRKLQVSSRAEMVACLSSNTVSVSSKRRAPQGANH